jgi:glutaminyl-peptide cyclotransferase
MGDDHLPFLHRGVSVLHVIAEPFPRVWHTLGVSTPSPFPSKYGIFMFRHSLLVLSRVHRGLLLTWLVVIVYRTMRRRSISRRCGAWNLIFRVFFAEYLGLRPEPSSARRGEPPSPTHGSAPVRKSDSELVRSPPPPPLTFCALMSVFLIRWDSFSRYYRRRTITLRIGTSV